MTKNTKWILAITSIILIVVNLLDNDFSQYRKSPQGKLASWPTYHPNQFPNQSMNPVRHRHMPQKPMEMAPHLTN